MEARELLLVRVGKEGGAQQCTEERRRGRAVRAPVKGKWETTDCTAAEKERERERNHVAGKEVTWPDFH
jgi:hypothetical protein